MMPAEIVALPVPWTETIPLPLTAATVEEEVFQLAEEVRSAVLPSE
jgi:hypothetical protein